MSLIAGNLGIVQRTLDGSSIRWGVCAGAAAHLYGIRRPIQDVDILVASGTLPEVVRLLQQQNKVVQFDGQRILWRGIKVFDDLSIRKGVALHPFVFDDAMGERLRRLSLLGALVPVLPPEDIVLHKLLLARGSEQGKHDHADAAGIVRRQQLDVAYLRQRMEAMRANGAISAALAELGVAL
ncbi:MAG TPA: hypothetical protein VNL77_00440 [Roseiflexaceae bacterium]|nr:hypothetical protein [Roseiflexaceae bacterium]